MKGNDKIDEFHNSLNHSQQYEEYDNNYQLPDQEYINRVEEQNQECRIQRDRISQPEEQNQLKCPICLNELEAINTMILNCKHKLSQDCFKEYIKSQVQANISSKIKCPLPNCTSLITYDQIVEALLSEQELYEKYLQNYLENYEDFNEKTVTCSCGFVGRVLLHEFNFLCQKCKNYQCLQCKQPHNAYVLCNEYNYSKPEDKQFYELLEKGIIKFCPKCRTPVERIEGCNFMTCHSPQCQGKVYFCYLCCNQLTKAEEKTHFQNLDLRGGGKCGGGVKNDMRFL